MIGGRDLLGWEVIHFCEVYNSRCATKQLVLDLLDTNLDRTKEDLNLEEVLVKEDAVMMGESIRGWQASARCQVVAIQKPQGSLQFSPMDGTRIESGDRPQLGPLEGRE